MASLASSIETSAKILPFSAKDAIQVVDGKPVTTSLAVADKFGKRHGDVIRAIRDMDCSTDFRQRNFASSSKDVQMPNGGTKSVAMHIITRDGFTFLCMGFTGAEAAKWKEAYINAFNEMEKELYGSHDTISPAQQLQLRRAVAKIASKPEQFKAVYHQLHDQFQISEYKQLPASQIGAALEFIASLDGEFIPRQESPNESPKSLAECVFSEEWAEARKRVYGWYGSVKPKMVAAGLGDPGFPELDVDDVIKTILLEQLGAMSLLVSVKVDKEMRIQTVPHRAVVIVPEEIPNLIKNCPGLSPDVMRETVKAAAGKL